VSGSLTNKSIMNYSQGRHQQLEIRDLLEEWRTAMDAPIQAVGERLAKLKLDGRPVKVVKHCDSAKVAELYEELKKIDPQYHPEIRYATHWKDVPELQRFRGSMYSRLPTACLL
jgi:hypothetical protein